MYIVVSRPKTPGAAWVTYARPLKSRKEAVWQRDLLRRAGYDAHCAPVQFEE